MEFYTGTRKLFAPGGCVHLHLLGPFRKARLGLILWVLHFRRTDHQLVTLLHFILVIAIISCYLGKKKIEMFLGIMVNGSNGNIIAQ